MAVSTPAVPASGTPVTNNTGQAVVVTVTGGTMTNVTVNGVTMGAGAGTYGLPAGGTIQFTYTVAPTWAWVAQPPAVNYAPGYSVYNSAAAYTPFAGMEYPVHAVASFTGLGFGVSN